MNERLKIFIETLKSQRVVHNFADFAQQLGKAKSTISEMINGKRTISESFVHEMITKFPMLNYEWMITGKGEMLINSENQPENPMTEQPEEKRMIDTLLFLVESQKKDIETLIQLVKEKDTKIDELLTLAQDKDERIEELLDEINARKRGDATSAARSSSASAV